MMRTVEIILVVLILATAFVAASIFAVLPSPRQISSMNLRELSISTLQMLNQNNGLSRIVFQPTSDVSWGSLQTALSSMLPPNIVYNFTVYDILTNPDNTVTYSLVKTLTDAKTGLGANSETSSLLVPAPDVVFSVPPGNRTSFTSPGATRLVSLQLGLQGGS